MRLRFLFNVFFCKNLVFPWFQILEIPMGWVKKIDHVFYIFSSNWCHVPTIEFLTVSPWELCVKFLMCQVSRKVAVLHLDKLFRLLFSLPWLCFKLFMVWSVLGDYVAELRSARLFFTRASKRSQWSPTYYECCSFLCVSNSGNLRPNCRSMRYQ